MSPRTRKGGRKTKGGRKRRWRDYLGSVPRTRTRTRKGGGGGRKDKKNLERLPKTRKCGGEIA